MGQPQSTLAAAQKMADKRERRYHSKRNNSEFHFMASSGWMVLEGDKLQSALYSGAIALLDSLWLVGLAERAQRAKQQPRDSVGADDMNTLNPITIQRRQDLPPEAFVTLDQVIAASTDDGIHVLMVSHMWLQPDHPDPHGTTLQKIAAWCQEEMTRGLQSPLPKLRSTRWGVFWDYGSLFQPPRSQEQELLFREGLDALAVFFSHPYVSCLQIKDFPPGYPRGYNLPKKGANCAEYSKRGWPLLESSLIWLKRGIQNQDRSSAPIVPERLEEKLKLASFTNAKNDRPLVMRLYRDYFGHHFSAVERMEYYNCRWGNEQIASLAEVIKLGYAPKLQSLLLAYNSFDHVGCLALVKALAQAPSGLYELDLSFTPIGDQGVEALCSHVSTSLFAQLKHLRLMGAHLGDSSCKALADALVAIDGNDGPPLVDLSLAYNDTIGASGCQHLCRILEHCAQLTFLSVPQSLKRSKGGKMLKASPHSKKVMFVE